MELTDSHRLVAESAARFTRERLAPIASEIDQRGDIPATLFVELAELGLMGVNVPARFGGSEAGAVAYALAMMEVSRGCASTAVTMAVTNMVAEVLVEFASEEHCRTHLPPILRGETLGAFALSEAGAGSDPSAIRTRATVELKGGERGYVLRGEKQWISHADQAGTIVVWAKTQGRGGATRPDDALSCFLVDGGADGLVVTRKEEKMGLRGSHTCALHLDGVWVPEDQLLGEEGDGFRVAMMALDGGRIGIASQAIGIGEAAFDAAVAYSKERKTFGTEICHHQAIQFMLADSRTELDGARLLALRAAALKEEGSRFTREASVAKLFASEVAWKVCDRALQVHGGYGYTSDYPVERHLRDARVTRIYEGTSEIQRMVIARSVLS